MNDKKIDNTIKAKATLSWLKNGAKHNKEKSHEGFLDIIFVINLDKIEQTEYFRGYPFTAKEEKHKEAYESYITNCAIPELSANLVVQIYDKTTKIMLSWEMFDTKDNGYYCGSITMPYKKYKTKDGYRWLKEKDLKGNKAKCEIITILYNNKTGEA